MGYSHSKRSLERVEAILGQMQVSKISLEFRSDDPQKLAHNIHNAIKYCKHEVDKAVDKNEQPPENLVEYSKLLDKFIVRIKKGYVFAELRSQPYNAVAQNVVRTLSKLTLSEVTNELGVVGALITHRADEVHFPNISDSADLGQIYLWTSKNGYHLIPVEGEGLLVVRNDPGEVAWKP